MSVEGVTDEPSHHREGRETLLEFSALGTSQVSHRLAPLASGATLDVAGLAAWILGDFPSDSQQTPYEGVKVRLVERGPVALPVPEPSSRNQAPSSLYEAIRHAVEAAIGSANRVAVLAGGGLDSAGLLALAVDIARSRGGSAFGVALDFYAEGDDRPYLRALQEHLRCEVVRVPPEAARARRSLIHGVDGAPFSNPGGPMMVEAIARARANGADVILTGAGGDDLFDGRPQALSRLIAAGQIREAVRAVRELRGFDWQRRSLWRWGIRPLLAQRAPRTLRIWRARRTRPHLPEWAGPALVAARRSAHARWLDWIAERLSRGELAEFALTEDYRIYHAWYRHQMELAAGLCRRDPFFDRALISFVRRLPQEWILFGNIRRGLFREAMRGLLPESLRMRPDKASFEQAMFRWVESVGGFSSFRHLCTMERLADLGLVLPSKFVTAFDRLARTPIRSSGWGDVWSALCVESFLRSREPS